MLGLRGVEVCGVRRRGRVTRGAIAVEVVVHGHVQGVFFRASTVEQARGRGLVGWVRNDPRGTVTARLQGRAPLVDEVLDWIRRGGPPHAHVAEVEVTEVTPDDGLDGFRVTR